jgi:hypothetical protein
MATGAPAVMRRLYLVVPGASLSRELLRELAERGVDVRRVRVFGARPDRLSVLGVPVEGLHPAPRRVLSYAAAGAGLGLAAALLGAGLGGSGPWSAATLIGAALGGAGLGALWVRSQGFPREIAPLRPELRRDDVVLALDIPDPGLGPLQDSIGARHPEIRVKGIDPAGSPPFP